MSEALDASAQALVQASPAPEAPSSVAQDTAVQAPEASQAPAASPKAEKPPVTDSSRFAALSRKEKALMKREADLEAKVQSKLQELESKYKPWQEVSELASSSKYEAMKRLGFREEDIRALGITPETVDPVAAAEKRAQEVIERRLAEDKQSQQDAQTKQYETAKQRMLEQAEKVATSDPELELLRANESYPAVVALIEEQYHATGEVLSVAVAAKRIETSIEDKVKALIESSPRLQKSLAERFTPKEPQQQPGQQPGAKSKPTPSLTHQAASAPPKTTSKLTSAQRLERAKRIAMGLPV